MENQQTSPMKKKFSIEFKMPNFGADPKTDWKIIFISTVILVVSVVVFSVYMFVKIDKGEIFLVEKTGVEQERVLDIDLLKETVNYYQNKAFEFERIKNAKTKAVDPSL